MFYTGMVSSWDILEGDIDVYLPYGITLTLFVNMGAVRFNHHPLFPALIYERNNNDSWMSMEWNYNKEQEKIINKLYKDDEFCTPFRMYDPFNNNSMSDPMGENYPYHMTFEQWLMMGDNSEYFEAYMSRDIEYKEYLDME